MIFITCHNFNNTIGLKGTLENTLRDLIILLWDISSCRRNPFIVNENEAVEGSNRKTSRARSRYAMAMVSCDLRTLADHARRDATASSQGHTAVLGHRDALNAPNPADLWSKRSRARFVERTMGVQRGWGSPKPLPTSKSKVRQCYS